MDRPAPLAQHAPDEPMSITMIISLSFFAAVTLQIYDTLVSFCDELQFVWDRQHKPVQIAYLSSRYGLLLVQLAHFILVFYNAESSDLLFCTSIYIYRVVTAQLALTLVEVILALRVSALYNRSSKAKRLVESMFLLSMALEYTASVMVIRALADTLECALLSDLSWKPFILFSLGAGLFQLVIVMSTVLRLVLGRRIRTPLTSLILKDSLIGVGLVFVLSAIVLTFGILSASYLRSGKGREIGNAAYAWLIALLSVLASRLLLNTRKVVIRHRNMDPDGFNGEEFSAEGLHVFPQELLELEYLERLSTQD